LLRVIHYVVASLIVSNIGYVAVVRKIAILANNKTWEIMGFEKKGFIMRLRELERSVGENQRVFH